MDFTMPYTPDVETCRSVRTTDEIRSDLEHDDPAVRAEACHQLGSSDDPQAFWLLARLLRADNGLVRGTFLRSGKRVEKMKSSPTTRTTCG